MLFKLFSCIGLLHCSLHSQALYTSPQNADSADVLAYHITLEPEIYDQHIKGNVRIEFLLDRNASLIIFNSGNLRIDSVTGKSVKGYENKDNKLRITLSKRSADRNTVHIYYQGHPQRGVVFQPESEQVYTVFHTSQWMPCHESPEDKAKIRMDLFVPSHLKCIASGSLTDKKTADGKSMYSWIQDYESPAYTYGFAIGNFTEFTQEVNGATLRYYSQHYAREEMEIIFSKTAEILHFFEKKSGVPYAQNTYSQVLAGDHYQEMTGFAMLKNSYGEAVLKDSTETGLISHELAHQWWGNNITCKNWNHFWLNEGFATYFSAAYNEHRFGKEKYNAEIQSCASVYERIKENGNDKPLVFPDWTSPTPDDRSLVYFKGAYVLHLLRQKLGDEMFWNGIRAYSREYFGRSVTTADFQGSMERATGQDLRDFFNAWIY